MVLPFSGGLVAKWSPLETSMRSGQRWWVIILILDLIFTLFFCRVIHLKYIFLTTVKLKNTLH